MDGQERESKNPTNKPKALQKEENKSHHPSIVHRYDEWVKHKPGSVPIEISTSPIYIKQVDALLNLKSRGAVNPQVPLPIIPVAATKESSTFRMATRSGTRSGFSKGTPENRTSWAVDERGINAFALPERDEPPAVEPCLGSIADVAPLRGTNDSAMGISGTCCVTEVSADGSCGGLEGGEPRRASTDANGLSETSDGTREWKTLLAVFLGIFVKLFPSFSMVKESEWKTSVRCV